MRTKNIITRYAAAFAAAALVLAGCQVETAKKTGQNPGSEELRFEVAAPHPDSGSDDTRALKTGWAEEDRIVAFFDHDTSKYIVLEYNKTDEKWVPENRSETLPAEGTNGSIQALHAGNGPGFAFDGNHIVGVFGDLLHTEEGTYTVDGDTVYLTLVMKRGMTTAIKMEGAGTKEENMKWRLSGPGIHVSNGEGTIPAENLLDGGEPAQIKFMDQLTTSFVSSDPLVAGAPDPMLTNDEMAVFHVFAQPHSAPGTTTLNIYNIDEPSVIYTRTYDKELTAGATILLAGPTSVDEADEWETVPPATDEPVEFRYNFVTGFNGDIYGEGTSQFLVMLTTYDPFGLNREGYQANIDFCTTAVSAPWTARYIDMPAGEYTFSATPATGTFTADDTSLKKYNAGGEVIENPTLMGGVVTVAIEGGVYTIDFNFDLDGGETFSGVYTGPLLFENPDYVLLADTFSADDPDGEGTIYYKRINLADPADKTVMVTNSAYNTTSANASYSGSVTVPATVTYEGVEYIVKEIGAYAFAGCTSLTSVTMADGITAIGHHAFYGCTSLVSVALPQSLTTIGNYAFANCTTITEVKLPDSVTYIPGNLFELSGISKITIPGGMTMIGPDALGGARSSVELVELPLGVTEIGGETFVSCTNLTAITLGWTTAEEIVTPDADCFNGTDKGKITLYVPAGTKAIYKAHPFWSVAGGFKAIVDPADHTVIYGPDGGDVDWTNR